LFLWDIPVTRRLTKKETTDNYEKNTGLVIVETLTSHNPEEITTVLIANHGPFVEGLDPFDAVHNAVIIEFLAKIETHTRQLNPKARRPQQHLIDKHYFRKYGPKPYYGQRLV
jgi:L-ribulose-5-phosphate 4-epimerase